jgi:hypothetical protein
MDERILKSAGMAAVIIAAVFLAILWQVSHTGLGQSDGSVVKGFARMQPLTPSMTYQNTGFFVSFTNEHGTTIKLKEIILWEAISGATCHSVTSSPAIFSSVKAGRIFNVTAVCPQKRDGEAYDMIITINYNATMSGITTTYNDTGHIKGMGEAY